MRVGYCRVSTQKVEQDISIEGQQQQLLAAGCDEVIVERASAFKGQRKGWTHLWALVASGKVTEVLVVDQSRLSRSGDDLEFLQACAMKKVQVRALTGGVIETESVGGFIQAGVMSVMNQAYSKLNSAKVKDGLARRRAAGHYAIGMVPFGYAYQDGLVVPHPDNWGPARERWERLMAMEMNLMGYCREFGGVSRSGLTAWVKNPMLRGLVPHQDGGVKPLISAEEWAAAKQLLLRRTRSRVPTGYQLQTHLFSSLIACDACERSLQVQRTASGKRRWKCCQPQCDWFGRSIAEELVRQQAIAALRLEAPRLALEAQRASNARATEKTSAQVAVENKIAQLEALRDSGVPELGTSIDALRTQLADMARPAMGPDWTGLAELIAAPGVLERFTDKQLRPLLLEYVAKFRYLGNPRKVEVVLKEGQ
jgi:DNA invertase Pin-like site-specific DNA recombinase